ncbi:MAG: DUF420 domain-containing protein [bacterium]|nr:DUF420 domain-containing protein [bacterium]MCP5070388.1 DUF420 domain-containing protein [bacterium]
MEYAQALPHAMAALNVSSLSLLLMGFRAIRRGERDRHRRIMLLNLGLAAAFLVVYLAQVFLVGHERFPGEGGLRSFFLAMLATHTVLAVSLVGLVPRTVFLALGGRFDSHRGVARITLGIWIYVAITGVLIYLMLHQQALTPA